jgi:hypothetical protein
MVGAGSSTSGVLDLNLRLTGPEFREPERLFPLDAKRFHVGWPSRIVRLVASDLRLRHISIHSLSTVAAACHLDVVTLVLSA